jgi:DMSO/TMAO reductase YedYZ heme-binding membrane subunit
VSQPLWWYTARASGLVAWVLVTAAVVWGLLLSMHRVPRPRPAWMLDLHRFLGGATLVLLGVHLTALASDSFVGFGWGDLFVPFASHWRPDAVAWGVVALYLVLVVELTSLMMRHLGRGLWHAIHLLSLVVFVAVTLHALFAGSDAHEPVLRVFAIAASALVAILLALRVVRRRARPRTDARAVPPSAVGAGSIRARR